MGNRFMSETNRVVHPWNATASGQYLLDWEQQRCDEAVSDIFGYHSLQWGMPMLQGLRTNRMPHRWLALESPEQAAWCPAAAQEGEVAADSPRWAPAFYADFRALPLADACMDLLILPHTLELSPDPHATLREVARVLVPEGRVVITGLNPVSLWGLRQRRAHLYRRLGFGELYLPAEGEFINYWRMRDWLRLLGFEVESGRFGLYRPAVRSEAWLERCRWFDTVGERWWPIFGAVYFIVAVKRVRGMRLLPADWKRRPAIATAPMPVAGRMHSEGKTRD